MGSNEEIRRLAQEAEKQQLFAQKVQQQNTTLTSQLELYKKRVQVLEGINKDNNYLNEFLEADERAKRYNKQAQSQFVRDRDIIRDLEKQRDKLELDVKDYKRQKEEYQKTQMIFNQTQRNKEEKYLDDILQLQAKIKDLENVAKIPKLYHAYELCDKNEQLHVFDSEETLEDAEKSQLKMNEFQKDEKVQELKIQPIDYGKLNKLYDNFVPQKELPAQQTYVSSSSVSSEESSSKTKPSMASMPSVNPMLVDLNEIEKYFKTLYELLEMNCKRESIFYTSKEEQRLIDDLHDEIDIISKESKDVSNESKTADTVCNDAFEVTQELSKRIVELEKDLSKFEAKSIAFEIAFQHKSRENNSLKTVQKENENFMASLQHENAHLKQTYKDLFESVQRSKVETNQCDEVKVKDNFDEIETKNIELEHRVASLIKENEHLKLTYKNLFDSIKKSRVQTKTSNVTQNKAENLKSQLFEFAEIKFNNILEKIDIFKKNHFDSFLCSNVDYNISELKKAPKEKQNLFENKTSIFQIKIDELENVLTQQTKDFNAVKLELSNRTAKFEAYFEKLKKPKVVLERQLARKVDDSKAENDQFLKEINHLRTQLENLNGKSVKTKFDKHSILGKPPADKLLINSQISKSWFTPKVDVQKSLSKPVTAQSLPKNEKDQLLKRIAYLESKLASQDISSCQKEYHELRTSYNALKVKFDSLNRKKWNINVSKSSKPKESVSEKVHTGESSKPFSKRVSQFTTYSLQKDRKGKNDNQDDDDQEDDDQKDDGQNDKDQDDVNKHTDSDNNSDDFIHPKLLTHDQEVRHNEEESDEEIQGVNVKEEELDEKATNDEDEANELYRDVNVNMKGRDIEMTDVQQTNVQTTQVIEDTHVIITPVNPEGQQQSSSVSSGFVSAMLNPNPDTGIDSIFNLNTESTSLIDVSVTTIAEPPLLSITTLHPPPTPLITHLQQILVLTPATIPSSSLQDLPNFGSLFRFDHRLKNLETDFSEFKQTNQFTTAVSSIPGIVDAYLANKMHEAIKTTIQLQSDRLRDESQSENVDFINKLDDNIKKIIKDQVKEQVKAQVSKILSYIKNTVNEQLKAEVLTCSSNESKTSRPIAANLSELELKKILIDKMESNKSIHRSNEQKNFYKALVDTYESDKLILDTYGDTISFKRGRDDEDKDEEPSAGSNRGSKRKRAGKELELTSAPKEKTSKTTSKSTKGSKSHHKSADEFSQA
ncbi:reverse transcriptase zinc-binding domain-containing protein [Tanacetum coccineum]|uniref:Reverse transcriptase zinc-binding domain-containing protein n=1 Tax=Tanacetum coccineum TaxID=301880 RepID=A0ABQ5CGM5_9ASTR